MPTGEIRDSDAIRVRFESRDSYFMDLNQILYEPLIGCALYVFICLYEIW